MLVLTRRINESIEVPELGISITILRLSGQRVKVGIEAPRGYAIVRSGPPIVEDSSASPVRHRVTAESECLCRT